MTKLEQLIKELCPNGLEYVEIGSVVNYEQPTKYIVNSTDYDDNYEIPVLTAGQTFILGYTDETDGVYNASKESPVIIFDDFTGAFKWVDFPFKVKSSAMKILTADESKTTLRYIYHIMSHIGFTSAEHKRLWISIYSAFQIPLPPLAVQVEIVKILDEYTESVTALQQELTAELTARKKQYEYYRDLLLDFGVHRGGTSECEWRTLEEVCTIKGRIGFRGYTRNDMVEKGQGAISFSPANIINHTVYYNDNTYISWEKYEESPEIMVEIGDVLLCKTGSTLGKTAIIDYLPEKATINPQLVVLKNIHCNSRFLKYFLTTFYFQNELQKRKGLGSVPNISQKELGDIMIPIPPAEEQERIVSILDRFDKLCNDISEGLPAEIEARRKQYEYYRDKLLSFKEQ